MSEISKVYTQYQQSLETSQSDYESRLKQYAKAISDKYESYLRDFVLDFSKQFSDQVFRLNMKSIAEVFFQTSDIPFVAIDGSCHKLPGSSFISFYGGVGVSGLRLSLVTFVLSYKYEESFQLMLVDHRCSCSPTHAY